MIQSTAPPKVEDLRLLAVSFVYATMLATLAAVQLLGFGGFDFAGIQLSTPGVAWVIMALAAVEIFALPFLLRLNLSPLARAVSALLSLAAPLLYLVNVVFIRDQIVIPLTMTELTIGALLGLLAIWSFNILKGEQALAFKKR